MDKPNPIKLEIDRADAVIVHAIILTHVSVLRDLSEPLSWGSNSRERLTSERKEAERILEVLQSAIARASAE